MTETQYVGVPPGLIDAVMHLVRTGPIPLGGYSLAEMVAVDAVVDFLDETPSEEEVGEAVRSLAARQLLVAMPDTDRLQVRGDLGIAVVFQQRARSVIDARVTGTKPGQPWRTLLLPEPDGVALEVLIDALGIHELSLREVDDALRRLRERLPNGDPEQESADPNQVLDAAAQTALVTVTDYTASGSTEIAQQSADIVLANKNGNLFVYNDVSQPGVGFESEDNEIVLLSARGERKVGRRSKEECAVAILDEVEALLGGA